MIMMGPATLRRPTVADRQLFFGTHQNIQPISDHRRTGRLTRTRRSLNLCLGNCLCPTRDSESVRHCPWQCRLCRARAGPGRVTFPPPGPQLRSRVLADDDGTVTDYAGPAGGRGGPSHRHGTVSLRRPAAAAAAAAPQPRTGPQCQWARHCDSDSDR